MGTMTAVDCPKCKQQMHLQYEPDESTEMNCSSCEHHFIPTKSKYCFTFGYGQRFGPKGYFVVEKFSMFDARCEMHKLFGSKWCTSYDAPEKAGVEKYKLVEVVQCDRCKDFTFVGERCGACGGELC